MTPELREQLSSCKTLPTPPGVAIQIVRLANDPDTAIDAISEVCARDPAITVKILRVVNSPLYAQRRKIDNLHQAIVVLGADATISFALSFSLLKAWQSIKDKDGLDYPLFWRRALLSAAIGRLLAKTVGVRDSEEVFLASLIQDIGVMALARSIDGMYSSLGEDQLYQTLLIQHERKRVGTDHAAVGAWLLDRWNFPDRISRAVEASHDPARFELGDKDGLFVRCVSLSGLIAETFLDTSGNRSLEQLAAAADNFLEIEGERFGELLGAVYSTVSYLEIVFETQILTESEADAILEEAQAALDARALRMTASSRRDDLTGLFNRRYMDDFLQTEFLAAEERGEPLSVAFVDLDQFKAINDAYGHLVGDRVLSAAASLLQANVRASDVVTRFGGDEFVLIFPRTGHDRVEKVCQGLVKTFNETLHDLTPDRQMTVTISVGTATHKEGINFSSAEDLLGAADQALIAAKVDRNCSIPAHVLT